ncbi:DUF2851 family protein [Nonlabens ponticola]|uniref:DUF2851 family protein n=2 Tax=Nonlabens ponticola TaxID=2496866 RepID=A0A3S9N192_9FLAO|nr:DUF2851 family protein [Nonlabens ponticola]
MQEDFIHYLWKFKKLSGLALHTTTGDPIVIKSLGSHNFHSGPDFFNSRLLIGNQLWAGNVEMHIKASDWYKHGHDDDPAYDNVILHVVWKHDAEISRRDEVNIPVLEVSRYVPDELIISYTKLFAYKNNQFINCEKSIGRVDQFHVDQWLDKLFIQRLEQRYHKIIKSLEMNNGDWESTFFQLLCRSFGTKVNADAFEQLATSIPQSTLRKLATDAFSLEAVMLGQAGLLDKDHQDNYAGELLREYAFAKAKHQLQPIHTPLKFFRLRPANYPTVRISQLAQLYHRNPLLFGELLLTNDLGQMRSLFKARASKYWDTHHVFDKETTSREKLLTEILINLIIINCVIPAKFAFIKYQGNNDFEPLLELMRQLPREKNTIVTGYNKLITVNDALQSQAVLQLKPNYCDVNKCLSCDIGVRLMTAGS